MPTKTDVRVQLGRRIERLTRRVAELQQFHDWAEPQIHDHGRDVLAIERLRAVLEEVRRCLPGTLERVPELRDRIDQALSGEPNSAVETAGEPAVIAAELRSIIARIEARGAKSQWSELLPHFRRGASVLERLSEKAKVCPFCQQQNCAGPEECAANSRAVQKADGAS